MTHCPICSRVVDSIKTTVVNRQIYDGCDKCLPVLIQGSKGAAKFNRETMKRDYQKDLVQPTDPRGFIKAYPDKAKEYYTNEQIRKYS